MSAYPFHSSITHFINQKNIQNTLPVCRETLFWRRLQTLSINVQGLNHDSMPQDLMEIALQQENNSSQIFRCLQNIPFDRDSKPRPFNNTRSIGNKSDFSTKSPESFTFQLRDRIITFSEKYIKKFHYVVNINTQRHQDISLKG